MGVRTKDVVVLAADQKATMGSFAVDLDAQKVYRLTDHIGITIAGGSGDAQTLVRFLRSQAKLFEIERQNKITTKALVTFIANILSGNRYYPFMVQFIVGGYTGQPMLYSLDAVGSVSEIQDYTVTGSGSLHAVSVLDTQYSTSMKRDDAIKLAVRAVTAAKKRDIYSGGQSVTVMVIDSSGIQELGKKDLEKYLAA